MPQWTSPMTPDERKDPLKERPWILVVEDEPELAESIRRYLERAEYRVLTANSVPEAIQKISRQTFTCIVLDLGLGYESGEEIIDSIRGTRSGFNTSTPILITSGNVSGEVFQRIRAKVQDVLVKPYSMRELWSRLEGIREEKALEAEKKRKTAASKSNPVRNPKRPKS